MRPRKSQTPQPRDDFDAAKAKYEETVVLLVELNTTMSAALENVMPEFYNAILVDADPDDMAKA